MKKNIIKKSNLEISNVGYGASGFGNLYRTVKTSDAIDVIKKCHEVGINYFDTAPHYGAGLSERRLGLALSELDVERSDIIISTKVGRLLEPNKNIGKGTIDGFVNAGPFDRTYDYSYTGIMRSFEDSLQRLGTSYVDILFIHDIGSMTHGENNKELFKVAMESGYKALDELKSAGLVKAIGLGTNEWQVQQETFKYADFDCFMLSGRYTLLEQTAESFLDQCVEKNVSIIAAAIYNSGILATGPKEGAYYDYEPAPEYILKKVEQIFDLCHKFNVAPTTAAIQFPFVHPAVVSVMQNTMKFKNIEKINAMLDYKIPSEFWSELTKSGLVTSKYLNE